MTADILTVMWKESRSLLRIQGSRSRTWFTWLMPVLFAIAFPLSAGTDWLTDILAVILAAAVPIIMVSVTIPDAFAGERERHTLATLLASRLPDRAILLGKLAVSILTSWGMILLMLLISMLVVNIANWEGRILVYTPQVAGASILLGLLMSTLTATLGVIISLRSSTVQGAQQTLAAILMVPPLILQFGAMFLLRNESGKEAVERTLASADPTRMLLITAAVLLALSAVFFYLALSRFQRSRLIAG